MRPYAFLHVATIASTSFACVTSARKARASPPSLAMMPTVSSAAARFTSAHSTRAPSRANATAVALPLPQPGPMEPAPTTSAALPFSRSAMDFLALGIECPQLGLEDLSVIVLRQRRDENIVLRPLETGNARKTQGVELGRARLADNISHHDLAPFRVGAADDRSFAHTVVLQQHLLDLARIDVRAARNDHVL